MPPSTHYVCVVRRLFMRGIDASGHVANMVETEQIVEYQGDRMSFVQVTADRGHRWTGANGTGGCMWS